MTISTRRRRPIHRYHITLLLCCSVVYLCWAHLSLSSGSKSGLHRSIGPECGQHVRGTSQQQWTRPRAPRGRSILELPFALFSHEGSSRAIYSWETVLLGNAGSVRVLSTHDRAEKDRLVCQSSTNTNSLFTIVLSTYGNFCIGGENEALVNQVSRLLTEDLPLDRVIISWNPHDSGSLMGAEDLLQHISSEITVPIEIVLHRENSLQNRFSFGGYLCTESVLHLDNDILIAPRILRPAFELHRTVFWDRILGFYCATIGKFGEEVEYVSWDFRSPPPQDACDFVLTGLAFVARSHHYRYFDDALRSVRENVVENEFSGEDLLMNFVVAHSLQQETSIGVTKKLEESGRVGAAVFFDHRKCFRRRAIRMDYGHDAVLRQNLFQSTRITRRKRKAVVVALLRRFGRIVGVQGTHQSLCVRGVKDVDEYGRVDTVRPLAFAQWYHSKGQKEQVYHVVLDTDLMTEPGVRRGVHELLLSGRKDVIVWLLYRPSTKVKGFIRDVCYEDSQFALYRTSYRTIHFVCYKRAESESLRLGSDPINMRFREEDSFVFPATSRSCLNKRCALDSTSLQGLKVLNCFNAAQSGQGECSELTSATRRSN